MGYCPSACAGSRYRELYSDTELGRLAWAQLGCHDTTIMARSAARKGVWQRARSRPSWWGSRNTKIISWLRGATLGRDTAQRSCNTAQEARARGHGDTARDTAGRALRHGHDTTLSAPRYGRPNA